MAAHGHGGILIISADEKPELPEDAPYRVVPDSSLATLMRLSRLLGRSDGRKRPASADAVGEPSTIDTQQLVRNAFLVEIERVTEELGALTAIDGATILNSNLALVGFGITLPVDHGGHVVEALDSNVGQLAPFDLGSRGTRHRAAAYVRKSAFRKRRIRGVQGWTYHVHVSAYASRRRACMAPRLNCST